MPGKRHLAYRCRSLSSELPYLPQDLPFLAPPPLVEGKSLENVVKPLWEKQFRISYSTLVLVVVLWPLIVMHLLNLFGTPHSLEMDYMPVCVARDQPSPQQAAVGINTRPEINAFIGVQTGFTETWGWAKFNYEARREILRSTWFPADKKAMDRMQEKYGIVLRFVIGRSKNETNQKMLEKEIDRSGPMFQLDVLEGYLNLARKSHIFFKTVTEQYSAKFIVKMDDDVYFRPDRLYHALPGYEERRLGYIGCMKAGPVVRKNTHRWFEPSHMLFGNSTYHEHANGPIYILSGESAELLATDSSADFRHFSNEDVTIGVWMVVLNVTFYDDPRLCTPLCSPYTIAQYNADCQGVCDPTDMLDLHRTSSCRSAALQPSWNRLPMLG